MDYDIETIDKYRILHDLKTSWFMVDTDKLMDKD